MKLNELIESLNEVPEEEIKTNYAELYSEFGDLLPEWFIALMLTAMYVVVIIRS